MRILLDSYHAEVIDPESEEPLDDYELGELVLTPLGRVGSISIALSYGRFSTGEKRADELGYPTFDS